MSIDDFAFYLIVSLVLIGMIALSVFAIYDDTKRENICKANKGDYVSTDNCLILEDGIMVRYGIARTNNKYVLYRWATKT